MIPFRIIGVQLLYSSLGNMFRFKGISAVRCEWLMSTTCSSFRRNYTLAEAAHILCHQRYTEKRFSPKAIPDRVLRQILELAQLCPSSFNLQPYKVIVVRNSTMKEAIATSMSPGNEKTVLTAPVTLVFAADKEPTRSLKPMMKMMQETGETPSAISAFYNKIVLMFGRGALSKRLRSIGSHLLSPIMPTPVITCSNEGWAMKNACLMAQQLMLVATAYGVRTAPMEGFDERRLSAIINLDSNEYCIPIVISMGYSAQQHDPIYSYIGNVDDIPSMKDHDNSKKLRFPFNYIFHKEQFGVPLELSELKRR